MLQYRFCFVLRAISKNKLPRAYICRGDLTEGLLRCEFVGLIFGGAYFRNFTVSFFIVIQPVPYTGHQGRGKTAVFERFCKV